MSSQWPLSVSWQQPEYISTAVLGLLLFFFLLFFDNLADINCLVVAATSPAEHF
jgi:hypothetical protein